MKRWEVKQLRKARAKAEMGRRVALGLASRHIQFTGSSGFCILLSQGAWMRRCLPARVRNARHWQEQSKRNHKISEAKHYYGKARSLRLSIQELAVHQLVA
jgi:hypothetical protein